MPKEYFFVWIALIFSLANGFPENLLPLNPNFRPPIAVFTGNGDSHDQFYVQLMKILDLGGDRRIAIAGKEKLFLLKPDEIQSSPALQSSHEVLSWESTDETQELCTMKGQAEELCRNYLSILENSGPNEILICATNAFDPTCRLYQVDGSGDSITLIQIGDDMPGKLRSPFGPNQSSASIFADGSLYSATYQSLFGGAPVLSRTMGDNQALHTKTHYNIMNEPNFVKMSDDGERILIFLNDIEELGGGETRTIAQVAQVCKNDVGGEMILQGVFTSFLKARLNCSYNGFYLNEIRDITDLSLVDNEMMFYATFTTPENSLPGSAVCSFRLSTFHETFSGAFMNDENSTPSSRSVPPVDTRHPGKCPQERLTDPEMLFVRSHPQMKTQVSGAMLLTNQGKRWTSIHVENIGGKENIVLFVGTDDGHLLRALPPTSDRKEALVISDQDVFDEKRCSSSNPKKADRRIQQILVQNDRLLIAFVHCVVTVPLRWCSDYLCVESCQGAADPYCGWNGSYCVPLPNPIPIRTNTIRSSKDCPKDVLPATVSATKPEKEIEEAVDELVTSFKTISPSGVKHNAEESISKDVFIMAVVGTALGTILVSLLLMLVCYCCRRRSKAVDDKSLAKKQMAEQHYLAVQDGEKRASLSRLTQNLSKLFNKSETSLNSPQNLTRRFSSNKRRGNNYTDQPSLKSKGVEPQNSTRNTVSRFNSISSDSQRQNSSNMNDASKPLLPQAPLAENSTTETSLPRHYTEANTLPLAPMTVQSVMAVSGSPVRSSFSSPISNGTVERGTSFSESAKLRRRSERAANQTTEIMRESDTAIREFENAYSRMEENGLVVQLHPPIVQNLVERQRIDSDDSGKGESPRNSLQNDPARNSKQARPTSLNVRVGSTNHRNRLHSEGSQPFEGPHPNFSAYYVPQRNRERHPSGQQLVNSHPTTPVGQPSRLSFCQANYPIHQHPPPIHQYPPPMHQLVEAPFYNTLQRQESCHDSRKMMQIPYHESHVPQQTPRQVPAMPHPRQQILQQPCNSRQVKLQRQMSEPAHVRVALQTKSLPPNENALPEFHDQALMKNHTPAYQGIVEQKIQKEPSSGPKNHYPSLPFRTSASPYGDNDNFTSSSGFERPSTMHRREKLPHLLRPISNPATARTGMYVPTPTVPNGEGV